MNAIVTPGESPSRDHLTVHLCSIEKQETIPQIARRGCNHGSVTSLLILISLLMFGYAVPVAASRGGTSLCEYTNKGECHEMLTVMASYGVGGVRSRLTSLYQVPLISASSQGGCVKNALHDLLSMARAVWQHRNRVHDEQHKTMNRIAICYMAALRLSAKGLCIAAPLPAIIWR